MRPLLVRDVVDFGTGLDRNLLTDLAKTTVGDYEAALGLAASYDKEAANAKTLANLARVLKERSDAYARAEFMGKQILVNNHSALAIPLPNSDPALETTTLHELKKRLNKLHVYKAKPVSASERAKAERRLHKELTKRKLRRPLEVWESKYSLTPITKGIR